MLHFIPPVVVLPSILCGLGRAGLLELLSECREQLGKARLAENIRLSAPVS
jgi:hypothetical protein